MATDFDIAQAAAAVYAESLLELANQAGSAEEIARELSDLKELWAKEPAFAAMMSSAAIGDDARREHIRKAFGGGRVNPLVLNLMLVLNDKRRSMIFPRVCDTYRERLDRQLGREDVHLTTAAPLEDRHREIIRSEIRRLTGRESMLIERVNPAELGGITIRVGDRLFDMTVRRRLRGIRDQLLASTDRHMREGASRFVTEG